MGKKRQETYKADLLRDLKNTSYAIAYLSQCAEETMDVFLAGLRDVAEAHGLLPAPPQRKKGRGK